MENHDARVRVGERASTSPIWKRVGERAQAFGKEGIIRFVGETKVFIDLLHKTGRCGALNAWVSDELLPHA